MTTLEAWDPDTGAAHARDLFVQRYGGPPGVVATAPGRVNLIGEHTDYNQGLCLPIALPHATYAAASLREDGRVRLVSGEEGETWEGDLGGLTTTEGWASYAAGVVWALGEAGHAVDGIDVAVSGCVPLGAGLSSSAALECSVGLAVLDLLGVPDDDAMRSTLARAGIRAENEVARAATGGMDQTIAVRGAPGHALLLDCRSWETRLVPFDPASDDLDLLVVDTRVYHSLNDGGYASRRSDCEEAARALGLASLREAAEADLSRLSDDRVRRRARHVVTEIARVDQTAEALTADLPGGPDWARVGELMLASHASMRDDFEISCAELDQVVESAVGSGAVGARMTGGGFGGSAIALVPTEQVSAARASIDAAFTEHGWRAPSYLPARASDSARVL